MMVKLGMISGPLQAIFHRHHVEPRVNLYVPRGVSFPILRHIDVTTTADTSFNNAYRRL